MFWGYLSFELSCTYSLLTNLCVLEYNTETWKLCSNCLNPVY